MRVVIWLLAAVFVILLPVIALACVLLLSLAIVVFLAAEIAHRLLSSFRR